MGSGVFQVKLPSKVHFERKTTYKSIIFFRLNSKLCLCNSFHPVTDPPRDPSNDQPPNVDTIALPARFYWKDPDIAVSWEAMPVSGKYRSGYSQSSIGWNTGPPMEKLEKAPKELKGSATLQMEQLSLAAYVTEDGLVSHHWEERPLGLANLSLIHIWRCRRPRVCRSRWSPYH